MSEWIRFSKQRAPWDEPKNPCEECVMFGGKKSYPDDIGCTEDYQNISECPYWNPEPLRCDVCGVLIWKGDMCFKCKREDERRMLETEFD